MSRPSCTPGHSPEARHTTRDTTSFRAGVAGILAAATLTAATEREAQAQNCFAMADLDNVAASGLAGCQWDVSKDRFSVGVTGVLAHPIVPQFSPAWEADLSMTTIVNNKWILGTSVGAGAYWADPNVAGYASAYAYFTGTMPIAPFSSSLALFYPKAFGTPNEDIMMFRQRLGVKADIGKGSGALAAGAQLFWPNSRKPEEVSFGAFAAAIKYW